MTETEHREFALIVVRNYDFFYTRHQSDLLYLNTKPTVLEDER